MLDRLARELEALLLATEKPLSMESLSELTGSGFDALQDALNRLSEIYSTNNHSIIIGEIAGGYRLLTDPDLGDVVTQLFQGRRPGKLTRAAIETLAVIAYNQPSTRASIEMVRGVNSDSALRTLLERKLISIAGRLETVGRPLQYETTDEFLAYFGLKDLDHLPKTEEISDLLKLSSDDMDQRNLFDSISVENTIES